VAREVQAAREAERVAREAAERVAREVQAAREAAERVISIRDGTYYSTLNQVWGAESSRYEQEHFNAMFRIDRYPTQYVATVNAAMEENNNAADESQLSRSSREPEVNWRTWPTDIFGNHLSAAEIAHLIPAASSHADTYDDVAAWAVGYSEQNEDGVKAKLVHGSRPPVRRGWIPLRMTRRSLRGRNRNISPPPGRPRQVDLSGLKHSDLNKMRLDHQFEYMDKHPCVLIVPAMTREAMLDWDGRTSYTAIVLVEANIQAPEYSAETVARGIQMGNLQVNQTVEETEATNEQVELARKLMTDVLRGLAFSLSRRTLEFRTRHNMFHVLGEITVPSASGSQPQADHHVRKVILGLSGLHPAPDPLLLAVKAAVVWSVRNGQRLLPGGEQDDDDNSSIESKGLFGDGIPEGAAVDLGQSRNHQHFSTANDSHKPPVYIEVPMPQGECRQAPSE
jgi:hypothetical protein